MCNSPPYMSIHTPANNVYLELIKEGILCSTILLVLLYLTLAGGVGGAEQRH